MIVSVTLARGAIRMARAHVIVKRLGAIHDLGSMDVLCTDKTGTLTEATISLARAAKVFEGLSADGFRALGVAWREFEPDRTGATVADERDLVFAGSSSSSI